MQAPEWMYTVYNLDRPKAWILPASTNRIISRAVARPLLKLRPRKSPCPRRYRRWCKIKANFEATYKSIQILTTIIIYRIYISRQAERAQISEDQAHRAEKAAKSVISLKLEILEWRPRTFQVCQELPAPSSLAKVWAQDKKPETVEWSLARGP